MTVNVSPLSLEDKFRVEEGKIFLTGVQALVRVALDQRRADLRRRHNSATFISGYPGSPLGGFDLELQRRRALLADHHIVHQMGVNEELAATAVMGSQVVGQLPGPRYDGVVGIWYGKANGLDRAMDAIRQANLCGTSPTGGALAFVGDDPTAKSSPTPGASEISAASLLMPILYPGDVQEVLDLGLHGVAMSRCSGLWTAIKVTTNVADGSGSAFVAPDRIAPVMVQAELNGQPYTHVPSTHLYGESVLGLEHSMVYARIEAALAYARANDLNRITVRSDRDRLGIVASGKTYYELRQALRELGLSDDELERLGVRLLQLRMPYPLDGAIVHEFAHGLREILVLEDKRPFVEFFIKDELYSSANRPLVVGKLDEEGLHLVPIHHELDSESIATLVASRIRRFEELPGVEERLARIARAGNLPPLPLSRSPYFCSGCPHNSSAATVPAGATVGGGTGCHVLAVFMPPKDVGNIIGITSMGGEGVQWTGASPFTELDHFIQNMGDGTYAHSGSLAIRAAIASGVNITYKLLYNNHVAMTGAQPAIGMVGVPALAQELLAEGVKRVIVTAEDLDRYIGAAMPPGVDVWERTRILEAQEALRAIPGVTVLIHDQECAAEKRRKRKRGQLEDPPMRVLINERVCEGCGDCGVQSNCLSVHPVETEFGRKTQIHQPSCNKDYSCLKGDCPSFITVMPGGAKPTRAVIEELANDELPGPKQRVRTEEFGMRITGIGGTGIVTVSQVLATAALLDGRYVRGLDQTGLAQKGGPVISDLKIATHPIDQANKLAAADCDLYLACDLLVASQSRNLSVCDRERTIAVVSTARVPTGHMVIDTNTTFPNPDRVLSRITGVSREGEVIAFDSQALTERLFGSDQAANMMLIGAAYQTGALPISAQAIEQAIELNGAAVDTNLQAFRRGRQFVYDRAGLEAALVAAAPAPPPPPLLTPRERAIVRIVNATPGSRLAALSELRVHELAGYQNSAYAERYARRVGQVAKAEAERVPGHTELAEAVAFHFHKLMAYKDEYEVARLHTNPTMRHEIQARFGVDAHFAIRLHPPALRAMGMKNKIALGEWSLPALRGLARMKRLRHTRLDPFGYAQVRRVERELIIDYERLLDEIVTKLDPANHGVAVELASLPDMVRGYEQIKLRNVEAYRRRVAELRPQLDGILEEAQVEAAAVTS